MRKYISLSILPLGVLVALICYYAVDIFVWDEWALVPLLEKYYTGSLTFWDFFAQHNEHRILLTKILSIVNAILTGWNAYYELAVNVMFAIGSSIVIFYAVEHSPELSNKRKSALYFTCACIIFSFTQCANYLHGFQMQIFMVVFFVLLSLALLTHSHGIFPAIISAALATYSFANGMLIWPVGFVLLLVQKRRLHASLWLVVSVMCIALYFHDYDTLQEPLITKIKYFMTQRPMVLIFSSLCYFGLSLSIGNHITSIALGFIMLCVQIYSLVKCEKFGKNILFWLGISMFVILSALATGYGRPGIGGSMQTRYATICAMFPIATLGIVSLARPRIPNTIYITAAATIIALSFGDAPIREARTTHEYKSVFKHELLNGEYDNELFLSRVFPDKVRGEKYMRIMKQYNMRNYANAPEVIYDDFHATTFTPDREITQCEAKITRNKNNGLLDVSGCWFIDGMNYQERNKARTYIIMYDDDGNAQEAELYVPKENFVHGWMVPLRFSDAYGKYIRSYFSGKQLYISSGKYRAALRVNYDNHNYYYMIEGEFCID